MEGLEKTSELQGYVRRKMASVITFGVIFLTIFDIAVFIYYLQIGRLASGAIPYLVQRVLSPLILNFALLSFMWSSECGDRGAGYKNAAVAWAICSICGVTAITHSSYVITWLAPSLGILLLTVSHNQVTKICMLIYTFVLATIACMLQIYKCGGYSDILGESVASYYVQHLAIVYACLLLMYFISQILHGHILEIMEENRNLIRKSGEYAQRVATDALTGCYSRDYLSHNIEKIFRKCTNQLATSVALIDIDNFKTINDTYGHDCGDQVLERIGKLGRKLGHSELEKPLYRVCRYGGEEFLFVFTDRNPINCQRQIEEFRRTFASQQYDFTNNRITVSGGIVCCTSPQEFDAVFRAVDEALYQAKNTGKNRIVVGKGL